MQGQRYPDSRPAIGGLFCFWCRCSSQNRCDTRESNRALRESERKSRGVQARPTQHLAESRSCLCGARGSVRIVSAAENSAPDQTPSDLITAPRMLRVG
jgi:hypothetical protein